MADIGGAETKLPVIFVIDVSGSMDEHIEGFNESFNMFLDKAKEEKQVRDSVDIEVITFSHIIDIPVAWSNIGDVPHQKFVAGGGTNIRDAMIKAKEEARLRVIDYVKGDIWALRPWIILMTDGYSFSEYPVDKIAAELRIARADVFALGMGTNYNPFELEKFTDKTMAIIDWDFEKFFKWFLAASSIQSYTRGYIQDSMLNDDYMLEMHKTFMDNK